MGLEAKKQHKDPKWDPIRKMKVCEFLGGPVVKTLRFHGWEPQVQSLVGELRSYKPRSVTKNK